MALNTVAFSSSFQRPPSFLQPLWLPLHGETLQRQQAYSALSKPKLGQPIVLGMMFFYMGTELTLLPSAMIKGMPSLHPFIFNKLLNFSKLVSVLPFFQGNIHFQAKLS